MPALLPRSVSSGRKQVSQPDGEVIITNDGATILNKMCVEQPAAKMMVELSRSQDGVAGDGTTSVTVLCGAMLRRALELLERGVHPTAVSDAFARAESKAQQILREAALPVAAEDRESLVKAAATSLSSKVVHAYSDLLSPMAVDCLLKVADPKTGLADLRDVRVVPKVGGTVDDSRVVDGVLLDLPALKSSGGPSKMENAKIAVVQFHFGPPKSDVENSVAVADYAAMDRVLREERNHILGLVKKVKKTGCNVLLIQKSILRDAVTDLAAHYLAKAKIMVVKDVEREEIERICRALGCAPLAHPDALTADRLALADRVAEAEAGRGRVVEITGIRGVASAAEPGSEAARGERTVAPSVGVLLRGSNELVLGEADRSLHDALCVVRCLLQDRHLVAGGGAPEVHLAVRLAQWAKTLSGMDVYCVRAYAEALQVIPYTLAENAGLDATQVVTELRALHAAGNPYHGINVRKNAVTNMLEENVVQPLLVTSSALSLATECVRLILKIDDIVPVR